MYDAVIVGAGPAGGQCARDLARKGRKILLIEKAKDFWENNYSSGGAPLHMMQDFELPSSIVGNYWNRLCIKSTKESTAWGSTQPFGVIIDFDKLRSFLSEEVIKHGGEFRLNCQYLSHTLSSNCIHVRIKDLEKREEMQLQTKILIDATGSERKAIAPYYNKNRAMAVTGIEYHIQVSQKVYENFANSLNFFLGHQWMPQGYGWIFPMAPYQLKIGVIRYFQNQNHVPFTPSYRPYLEQLLALCGSPQPANILDKHGKTIYYTLGQADLRYEGPVLALGDAISSINPLGCEGIRHALAGGQIAAIEIDKFLQGKIVNFKGYHDAMTRYFGYKWCFSEILMKSLFKTKNDSLIDRTVRYFSLMNNQEIMDVIFQYRFRHALRSYFWYFCSRFKDLLSLKKI